MSAPLIVSAPGKVILTGEHAVVYGKVSYMLRWTYEIVDPLPQNRVTVQDLLPIAMGY